MHGNLKDRVGQRYGRLTVVQRVANKHGKVWWSCRCDCGTVKDIRGTHLSKDGIHGTVSCGCYNKDSARQLQLKIAKRQITHGMSTTPTYYSYRCMILRCTYIGHTSYPQYGGRGITVCDRWLDSFENFLKDMGERPEGCTNSRLDHDGNYEPANCEWAFKYTH